MADRTGIVWTDRTWNPAVGCRHVSPGCDHCYAARLASTRLRAQPAYRGLAKDGQWTGLVRMLPERLRDPLSWRRPHLVFVDSMGDLFHAGVTTDYLARIWAVMALTSRHTYQILTKNHGRMRSVLSNPDFPLQVCQALGNLDADLNIQTRADVDNIPWPLPNVGIGVSAEDQERAELRIPALQATPAACRFLSLEPLIEQVRLCTCDGAAYQVRQCHFLTSRTCPLHGDERVDWVIVGGESGRDSRPMHPEWARRLRDECVAAGVPFLFKQWGHHLVVPVENDPDYAEGRAFTHPLRGGRQAAVISYGRGYGIPRGRRALKTGDRTGYGFMLTDNLLALSVGTAAAGRVLDGRKWDQYPAGWRDLDLLHPADNDRAAQPQPDTDGGNSQ